MNNDFCNQVIKDTWSNKVGIICQSHSHKTNMLSCKVVSIISTCSYVFYTFVLHDSSNFWYTESLSNMAVKKNYIPFFKFAWL